MVRQGRPRRNDKADAIRGVHRLCRNGTGGRSATLVSGEERVIMQHVPGVRITPVPYAEKNMRPCAGSIPELWNISPT